MQSLLPWVLLQDYASLTNHEMERSWRFFFLTFYYVILSESYPHLMNKFGNGKPSSHVLHQCVVVSQVFALQQTMVLLWKCHFLKICKPSRFQSRHEYTQYSLKCQQYELSVTEEGICWIKYKSKMRTQQQQFHTSNRSDNLLSSDICNASSLKHVFNKSELSGPVGHHFPEEGWWWGSFAMIGCFFNIACSFVVPQTHIFV